MTVTVEMKISYFNSNECVGVDYTTTQHFANFNAARSGAQTMLETAERDAIDDGAMPGTFFFDYDYIMPQSLADDLQLDYTMEPA